MRPRVHLTELQGGDVLRVPIMDPTANICSPDIFFVIHVRYGIPWRYPIGPLRLKEIQLDIYALPPIHQPHTLQ